MTVLIQDTTIVAMDDEHGAHPFRADIRIEGDRIAEIGRGLVTGDAEVIDGRRRLAIPGLVNAHFHSDQNFLRGRYQSRPLEVMMLYTYPLDPSFRVEPELVRLRTLAVACEALKSGVTCLLDDCCEMPNQEFAQLEAIFNAYEQIGIRANCSGNVINRPFMETIPYADRFLPSEMHELFSASPLPTADDYIAYATEAVERFHGRAGRLRFIVAPSAPQRCTAELLVAAAEFADQHDLSYHTHVLETKVQQVTAAECFGKSLIRYLGDIGVLRRRVTLAHAIWVDDEDIDIMASSGCSVAHNPACNLRMGAGIAPLRKLLDAGVNVGLGTDAIDSNDSGRIFDVMHLTGLIHSLTDVDYERWPTTTEVLRAATMGGARAVGLEREIGSLEVGKKADIVLLTLDAWPLMPLNDPSVHLVHAENGSSVRDVIVGGEIVVRDGELTRINEAEVMAEIHARAPEYLSQRDRWEAVAATCEPHMRALYEHCATRETGLNRLAHTPATCAHANAVTP